MTVNEVIKHIIPVLEGIKVPMTEVEAIGIPVAGAISDLKKCVAFMDSVEQEQAAKKAAEHKESENSDVKEENENDEHADV